MMRAGLSDEDAGFIFDHVVRPVREDDADEESAESEESTESDDQGEQESDDDDAQDEALALPFLPTTTIGSFPQTGDIRKTRAAFTKGDITLKDDDEPVDKP